MKQSTIISYFFFVIAILLELLSVYNPNSDLRLFVGVFLVLGLAFLVYSLQETFEIKGALIFESNEISNNNLQKPIQKEYVFKSNQDYLWIPNSIYLNWTNDSILKKIMLGVWAAISGHTLEAPKHQYILFNVDQEIYLKQISSKTILNSSFFNIKKTDNIKDYYDKTIILARFFSLVMSAILVIYLVYYILKQIV